MAAHLFNESGQMQEVDIPDIFDVLEGGEDESAVKFLLGFNGDDPGQTVEEGPGLTISTGSPELINNNGMVQQILSSSPLSSPTATLEKSPTPARVVVQIEPPTAAGVVNTMGQTVTQTVMTGDKTDKPRKREPVDPSRCIYACESCGKAFTTKFNLKRHINMHCSRSREAGVPIQGPPSASQPSRKNKSKDSIETVCSNSTGSSQIKVRRVSASGSNVTSTTTPVTVVTTPMVKTVTNPVTQKPVTVSQTAPSNQQTATTYQTEPMTVQLAVNAQGQPRILTTTAAKPASLPVQPLPESAVQLIQSLNTGSGQGTHRIVRIINAPQIIATQSRGGITTGATVQLQAIPVTGSGAGGTNLTLPQQPLPLVQQIGTRQIVLTNAATAAAATTSTSLTKMAHRVADIMPGIAATALDSAQKVSGTLVNNSAATLVTTSTNSADVLYRSILTPNSPNLTPLTPVTSTTISSPTGGFNLIDHQPPADLFDSEDGDALSVATTTETPTPPPSLNGDTVAAIKSLPDKDQQLLLTSLDPNIMTNTATKVVVIQQPPQLCPPPSEEEEDTDIDTDTLSNTASLLPSNRFHGQLTSIPKGWLRKVVTTSKGFQQVFYYNPVGKRFSCQEEIDQYFARLGYSVPISLFNFELPKLVDEDEDDDEVDDLEDNNTDLDGSENDGDNDKNNHMVVKVTSNAKGEATVTPTTSTIVALPSGTIVTRADTTVDLATPNSAASLVTSSKPLLSTASKVMLAKTST